MNLYDTKQTELCSGCLCTERKLTNINNKNYIHLYKVILDANPVDDGIVKRAFCWECDARMRKFYDFTIKIKHSNEILNDYVQTAHCYKLLTRNVEIQMQQGRHYNINLIRIPTKLAICELESYSAIEGNTLNPIDVDTHSTVKIEQLCTDSSDAEPCDSVVFESFEVGSRSDFCKSEDTLRVVDIKPSNECSYIDKQNVEVSLQRDEAQQKDTAKVVRKKRKRKKVKLKRSGSDDETPLARLKEITDAPAVESRDWELVTLTFEKMMELREAEKLDEYYLKSPYRCDDCIVGFKFERTLLQHNQLKHIEGSGGLVCEVCRLRFTKGSELAAHVNQHLVRYRCKVCDKMYTTQSTVLKHLKNHLRYSCDDCGHISDSLFRHQAHLSKAHKEKPVCKECNKIFSSSKTYRYHVNVIHNGQNRFPCPHCARVYQWKSNLWRHIKNHKVKDTGQLVCVPCDKKFSSIATFQQHLKISSKHVTESQFSYKCDECSKKFVSRIRLKDHIDWEHLNKVKYKCNQCDKPFKTNTSLYVHVHNVHRNKVEKDNLCHVCGKSYQNKAKLRYHITAMHTSETPYSCNKCSSTFSWYSSLYRHTKDVHHANTNKNNF